MKKAVPPPVALATSSFPKTITPGPVSFFKAMHSSTMNFVYFRGAMVKALCLFVALAGLALPSQTRAQGWQPLGPDDTKGEHGFSAGYVDYLSFALDKSGVPYVCYQDGVNGYKATVRKFNGTTWVDVGLPGFSPKQVEHTAIALDGNGTPYVAYMDWNYGTRVTVRKFAGTSWVDVGTPGFSAGGAQYISIALDGSGVPFVAYRDNANGNKATVKKFNGTNWVDVGTPGFSAVAIFSTCLNIDGSGAPYVAFGDVVNGSLRPTVKKFTNGAWVDLGAPYLPAGQSGGHALALNASGSPYLAYNDPSVDSARVTVRKLTGTTWENVGPPRFSGTQITDISLALDGNGVPYLAFVDGYLGSKAVVKKFNGTSWEDVGTPGFSAGAARLTHIRIHDSKIYVAYIGSNAQAFAKVYAGPEPDDDQDGIVNSVDNCPTTANPDQADTDSDGIGDACDPQIQYVFTGNGKWYDPANWKDGLMPPSNLPAGSTITITGTAINGETLSDCLANCQTMSCPGTCPPFLIENQGTIVVAAGGSLTLRVYTQFMQRGVINVAGTLINQTALEGYSTGSINVSGTFINQVWFGNQGSLVINSGGVVRNEVGNVPHPTGYKGILDNGFGNPGTITINPGGTLTNTAPAVLKLSGTINNGGAINNSSIISGNPTINGDLTNAATLSPGASPGIYTINGNYTATATAVHKFEVGGPSLGSYDRLTATGNVNLAGTLTVTLINGFTPTTDHDLQLFTGTINGTFSTVNLPFGYTLAYYPDKVLMRGQSVSDADSDGVVDAQDNCPSVANADQKDTDSDGQGDACDLDDDGDNIVDAVDNCPLKANADQMDMDGDRIGDACDPTDDRKEYVFTGNGHWHDPANWKDGLMPFGTLPAGSTITITGTAINGMPWSECQAICQTMTCPPSGCPPYLDGSNGTIVVAAGGTLTLQNYTQFSHKGSLIVEGTLINKTHFEEYYMGTITVSGTFINEKWIGNQGLFTINAGGVVNNTSSFLNQLGVNGPGIIELNSGGTINNYPPGVLELGHLNNHGGVVNNYSVLSGNATVNGDLTNSGTLASGTYVINGNYTATASSVHQFKVGGTTTGSYDRLTATGNVNLAGTLTVTLKIGYTPTTDQDLPILTGTINGTFSTVNLPPNYSLVYNPDNVTLRRRTDVDSDGVWDSQDNCTTVANADQKDTDGDGQGDACDTDDDGDGITDSLDKCPLIASTINTDNDGDGLGDVCDPDDDNDGWDDVVDNCPKAPNPNQEDFDADGIGDWCDFDRDGDGLDNSFDNCPQIPNIDQLDTDGDWDGDVCDWDDDDDLIADGNDNCPTTANADQRDSDGDGLGDACDGDDDGDGTPDIQDCAPLNAAVHPGAADICNGIDDDCDGLVDEDCATVLPAISIADAVVYEAAGSVTLTVSLSKAPSQNVKVVFTTVNGTAVASGKGRNAQGDYTATKGTLTFRAGSLTGTITIPIANDGAAEGDEQFSVQLSAPTNATIQDGAATVTIKDGVAPGLTQARADKAGQPELLMGRLTVQATPNPSQHRFALVTRSGSSQPLDIKVLDMLGRVVEQRSGVAANGTYYLGDRYRPGVYQVRVVQGGQIQTLKLVKQP